MGLHLISSILADSLPRWHVGSLDSGEDDSTEQAIPIPDDNTSKWLSNWEMECQILTDGDTLSDAGGYDRPPQTPQTRPPPIAPVDTSAPNETSALPESIGKLVEDGRESATAGSQPNVRDPQGQQIVQSHCLSNV